MLKQKIYIGITNDNELYYIEIEQPTAAHDYFAMSGSTVDIQDEDTLKDAFEEDLQEGGYWEMAVADHQTELGKDDWIEQVMNIDGWESHSDINYNISPLEIDGKQYYFTFRSGGQHEEPESNIKHFFIPVDDFRVLMNVWKNHHLKKESVQFPASITNLKQDERAIAAEAAKIMLADN